VSPQEAIGKKYDEFIKEVPISDALGAAAVEHVAIACEQMNHPWPALGAAGKDLKMAPLPQKAALQYDDDFDHNPVS